MKKLFAVLLCLMLHRGMSSELPVVYVSILPQLESVRAIGRGVCRGEALLSYGQNPEMFQLNARTMSSLRRAKVFLGLGLPFEKIVMPRIRRVYPDLVFEDLSRGMHFHGIGSGQPVSGAQGASCHAGADPHVWLSVENMLIHSREVQKILCREFPGQAEKIRSNGEAYRRDLLQLKGRLEKMLAGCRGRDVLVYHPAFGYFLREFGLVQRAVEKDGKAPGGSYLDQLIREIRDRKISTLFYQPQFSSRLPKNLSRRLGLKLMTLDPLPEKYSAGMIQMAEKVAAACADQSR